MDIPFPEPDPNGYPDVEAMHQILRNGPTNITKIEFENPIVMYEGDSLRINFVFTPDGMKCDVILETADGRKMVVGEDVEDVIE